MRPGKHIEPWRMGMSYQNLPASVFENFDVDWFCDIQNHGIAQARYRFLATPAVIAGDAVGFDNPSGPISVLYTYKIP